jgi:hypothetical protein
MTLDELQALPWADTLCEAAASQVFLAWLNAKLDEMLENAVEFGYLDHAGRTKYVEYTATLSGRIKEIEITGTISV